MAKTPKFYVVWTGRTPGIYRSWADCEAQVKGYPAACYKSFATLAEAEAALHNEQLAQSYAPSATAAQRSTSHDMQSRPARRTNCPTLPDDISEAIAVDAACSKNPGPMEYRGVHLPSGHVVFHFGPIVGTNNIGEFLAIVHALALLEREGKKLTIFSDSRNAIGWVRRKQCKTTLANNANTAEVHRLIARAENWLKARRITNPIRKWETEQWGEIPADFGRK